MMSLDPPFETTNAGIPHDEAALVARLRAADDGAFEQLVRLHGGRMLATARRLLGDESDACDAVQEAYISAFKSIGRFEGGSKLSTWLHRIVVNCALMKLRSRSRRSERSIDELLPTYLEDGHRRSPGPAWDSPADAMLEREETRQMVRRCIGSLPEDYRTVLLLRDIEELNTEETAQILGINIGAVKTRLHRARQALQTLLERELVA
jgi:RNA polymerase sigma-70 factor (ECF subfamily)